MPSAELSIFLTGALVAIAAAPLGLFLVLRGTAMLTDAISHAIVLGIVLVWMATGVISGPLQLAGASAAGVATVAATAALQRSRLVSSDAAIGLVFPALFALGVLLINIHARDVHLDVDTVLLGEIGFVWLDTTDILGLELPVAVVTLGLVAAVNIAFVAAFWKELKLGSFDPALAAALGLAPGLLHQALLVLTSVTAVASFDAVGVIMLVAFVIVPSATALFVTDRPGHALVIAMIIGTLSAAIGQMLAFRLDVSIGGMMAVSAGGFLVAALLLAPHRGVLAHLRRRRRARREHDLRTLLMHLLSHEDTPQVAIENSDLGLSDHLHWRRDRASRTIVEAIDRGMVDRAGSIFVLTDKGRARAHEVFARTPRIQG